MARKAEAADHPILFFSSRRRHTRSLCDWSSDVCSSDLTPEREHGFHIHDAGDCSSGDGMSAKGHFNPLGRPHGHPDTPERHAGDMPALKADLYGNAALETDLDIITVTPGPTSIVGRGLIVHADPDDYRTQPTGNAGARLACAVIQRR